MGRPKKVLLLSHIPQRDEIADQLIAQAVTDDTTSVWKYPILVNPRQIILLVKPDVVVFPEIRLEVTRDMAKLLKSWGVTVVQRRCEMGMSSDTEMTEELSGCLFGNVDWHDCVDYDLVWGQDFADMLIEKGMPKEKVHVTGGIGFDQYFQKFPFEKKEGKKKVLFATGFGYADSSALYAIPESKAGSKINQELVMQDRNNRNIFVGMMKQVMEAFPNYEYLVRPHPGEVLQYYANECGDQIANNNIASTFTPMALNWADVVIHSGSTMAYEAHLMNKPTFNFRNTSLDEVVGSIAPTYHEVEPLIEAIKNVEFDKSNAVNTDLEKYYGVVDGNAHKRIAEIIKSIPIKQTSIPNEWPKDELKYPTPWVFTDLIGWTCSHCGNMFYTKQGTPQSKCPYCGIACVDVEYRANKFKK